MPRAPRAEHRAPQALQAAQHGGRVLARRFPPPDAAADLRHGLLQEGRTRRAPAPAGRGAEARPSPARQGTGPLHVPSLRPRRAVLDRPRHHTLQPAERVHAGAAAGRLPGDQDPVALQQGAVGDLGSLGQVPREHVPGARQRDRRARHVAQADELPVALPDVWGEEALVSRAAHPLHHVRRAAPQRGEWRAVGPHAGAPVPAGRLPHLPDGIADRGRGAPADPVHPVLLRHVRAQGEPQVCDPAGNPHRR